jgi:hypothetical protein
MSPTIHPKQRDCGASEQRVSERRTFGLAGRVVWKDARGTTRFNTVVIRDISETGAYVESVSGSPIPLYRLVVLQAERSQSVDGLPATLRQGRLTAAVYRVGPASQLTGAPEGYGLRLLVEPRRRSMAARGSRPLAELVVAEASA